MKTEKHLHNYFKKECKEEGIGCFKLHCEGRNGWPDLLLAYDGWCIFVELKSPAGTGRVSPIQKTMIERLHNLGLEVYVIDSQAKAAALINELIGRGPE